MRVDERRQSRQVVRRQVEKLDTETAVACMPGDGGGGDEVVAAGQPETEVQAAAARRAGALDERATHAEVGQPFVAAREDAVLPPPDFNVDDDAFVDSVFFRSDKGPRSRTRLGPRSRTRPGGRVNCNRSTGRLTGPSHKYGHAPRVSRRPLR